MTNLNQANHNFSKSPVVASAPGKINIYFEVGSLKADGFHEVVSVYQAMNLRDRVSVCVHSDWLVEVNGNLNSEHLRAVPTGRENLVVKAAMAIASECSIIQPDPVRFAITKTVPVAGGMGGGSADAAAALLAVNELWGTQLDDLALHRVASRLGADVPFALIGGTAVGTGRGNQLEQVERIMPLHWVLVSNSKGLSTPSVYQKLDELRAQRGIDPYNVKEPKVPIDLVEALRTGDAKAVAPLLRNDLQEAALSLMPELAATVLAGLEAGALAAMVSGSGPTIALLAPNEQKAIEICELLKLQGHSAIATHGPAVGTILESESF